MMRTTMRNNGLGSLNSQRVTVSAPRCLQIVTPSFFTRRKFSARSYATTARFVPSKRLHSEIQPLPDPEDASAAVSDPPPSRRHYTNAAANEEELVFAIKSFYEKKGIVDPRLVRAYASGPSLRMKEEVASFVLANAGGPVSNYIACMSSLNRMRLHRNALQMWDKMKQNGVEPTLVAYNVMIHTLFLTKNDNRAQQLFQDLKNAARNDEKLRPDVFTYGSMIAGFKGMGKYDKALQLAEEMKKEGGLVPNETITNCLVDIYAARNETKKALQVVEDLTKTKEALSAHTYFALMRMWAATGQTDQVLDTLNTLLQLLQQRKQHRQQQQDERANSPALAYSIAIEALCKKGMATRALQLLNDMRDQHQIPPSIQMYNTIFNGFAREANPDAALNLFHEIEASFSTDTNTNNNDNTTNTTNTYNTYNKHKTPRPDVYTIDALLKAHLAAKPLPEAFELFDQVTKKGYLADKVIYGTLIKASCEAEDLERAVATFNSMQQIGVYPTPDTCKVVLDALIRNGHVDEVLDMLSQIGGHVSWTPTLDSLLAVGNACRDTTDLVQLDKLVERWIADYVTDYEVKQQHPNKTQDNTDNNNDKSIKNKYEVTEDKWQIQRRYLLRNGTLMLTDTAARLRCWDQLLAAFERLRALGRNCKGLHPELPSIREAIRALRESGKDEEAFKLYEGLLKGEFAPFTVDNSASLYALRACKDILAKAGDTERMELRERVVGVLQGLLKNAKVHEGREYNPLTEAFVTLLRYKWIPENKLDEAEEALRALHARSSAVGERTRRLFNKELASRKINK